MIHFDIKQLDRLEQVGHRINGDLCQGSSRGAGYEKIHVASDDTTRLAYVEVLADAQKAKTVGTWLVRSDGSLSKGSPVGGCFRTKAVPTAPVTG